MREVTRRLEVSVGILIHTADVILYSAYETRRHSKEIQRENNAQTRREMQGAA